MPRFYPDEWLIANVLRKYAKLRVTNPNKSVLVLAENWAGNGVPARGNTLETRVGGEDEEKDEGYSNTPGFNKEIIDAVKNCKHETLIVVPYLYVYHHPGLVIHMSPSKNKGNAIYIDPFGTGPTKKEVFYLLEALEKTYLCNNQQVKTKQQHGGNICGFVLTASMMKFIEEFITVGKITINGFLSPKPNMDTAYLFQMYVNNWQFDDEKPLVDEVMLAEKDLWNGLIDEQKIQNGDKIKSILAKAIEIQDTFLMEVIPTQEDIKLLNKMKLDFIRDFQAKMVEIFFIKPDLLLEKVESLALINTKLLAASSVKEFTDIQKMAEPELHLENLLSNKWLDKTKKILKISQDPIEHKHAKQRLFADKRVLPVEDNLQNEKTTFNKGHRSIL